MISFENMNAKTKKKLISVWGGMNESDKTHFINQVAITLSVLGADDNGKREVEEIINHLIDDGTNNLADFGIYLRSGFKKLDRKERRIINIVDNYRLKYDLPTLPSKPLV